MTRAVITKTDDDPMMQTMDLKTIHSENHSAVERFQIPGFSSVPMEPKDNKHAEALVVYPQGNSSHPVIVAVDDRRVRPKKQKPGTAMFYDQKDNTRNMQWDENGNLVLSIPKEKSFIVKMGDDTYTFGQDGLNIKIKDEHFVKVNDKRIDHKHKHKDVQAGPDKTGEPIE